MRQLSGWHEGDNVFATIKDETEIHKAKHVVEAASSDIEVAHGDLHMTVMDVLSQDAVNSCAKHIAGVQGTKRTSLLREWSTTPDSA